jgi:IS5 family transposase
MALRQRAVANKVLETITRELDFGPPEARVAGTYSQLGRPACRVGVLLRIMILEHLYGLSDPQVEEQIHDRLSFQKFLQLAAEAKTSPKSTIAKHQLKKWPQTNT